MGSGVMSSGVNGCKFKRPKLKKNKNKFEYRLIVVEGIDGAGKTTIVKMIKDWLESLGYKVKVVKEPGSSKWGKKIRESYYKSLPVEEELELFIKDREYNVKNEILPAMEKGYVVVMDRYYYSTVAYQGARGLNPEYILKRNLEIIIPPDVVILLDCDPEVCVRRIEKRSCANRFEKLEYLKRVREIFLDIAKKDEKVKVVNSDRSVNEVFEEVKKILDC